ncbi:immunity-specific protein beta201 [Corynebacterium ulcerans]|nr:immunity-specific protein beta201 [Corynebacterium ulcerans]
MDGRPEVCGLSGMKSKVQAKTLQAIGQPGQITESTQIQAMEGAITLALAGENGGPVDAVYRQICEAFSQTLVGTLSVETGLHGTIYTRVKAAAPIPAPKSDLLGEQVVDSVEISLISDEGVWWTEWVRGEGTVLVTNDGGFHPHPDQVEGERWACHPPIRCSIHSPSSS